MSLPILIDTDNLEQIEFVRSFLSNVRNEYNEYHEDSMLKHQSFSNVIHLLANRIERLENKVKQ
jgi:hypothetical protein